jgi:hypothetical protein
MNNIRRIKWYHAVSEINCCQQCKNKKRLLSVKFRRIKRPVKLYAHQIKLYTERIDQGKFCAECTLGLYKKCQRGNLLGMLGIVTIPFSILFIILNTINFCIIMLIYKLNLTSAFNI